MMKLKINIFFLIIFGVGTINLVTAQSTRKIQKKVLGIWRCIDIIYPETEKPEPYAPEQMAWEFRENGILNVYLLPSDSEKIMREVRYEILKKPLRVRLHIEELGSGNSDLLILLCTKKELRVERVGLPSGKIFIFCKEP